MLKDKSFDLEEGKVYGLRSNLVGEVVAKVLSVSDNKVLIQNPVQLAQQHDGSVGLVPAFPLADKDKPISVPLADLLHYEVSADVKHGYTSTTSGLAVPKQSGIITK